MPQSPANKLTNEILLYLYKKGAFAWRQNVSGIPISGGRMRPASKKGVPDIIGCFQAHFFGVEVKIGKDILRPEQIGFIRSVAIVGGTVFVAKNFKDFTKEFELWIFAHQ